MSEVKKPTPKAIDKLIDRYATAQARVLNAASLAAARKSEADALKAELVELIEAHGFQHAAKSKRILGVRNMATSTTGVRTVVHASAVDALKAYLDESEIEGVTEQFFSERISYQLVDSPADVLKTLTLSTKIRNKISSLVGLCFGVATNAPSLKVDVVPPAEPA